MNGVYTEDGAEIPEKWLQCDGQQLRKLLRASLLWLEENHQEVNALNVFPVPDGDTGTNMLLTMRAAYNQIQESKERHVGEVAHALAHGALMGARGNSGVILSQIWRGLARALQGVEVANCQDIARAFREASDTAYKGVMRPVEGTILTVIREASEEAQEAASKSRDLRFVMERVLERSQQALERTPEMLPVLKQAGVVDSGGQGFVYILEGMLRYADGLMHDEIQTARQLPAVSAQALAAPTEGVLEYPYDVQFILMGQGLNVLEVREAINAMGDSTVVVGDEQMIKVHIHVKDPGEPLSYGSLLGRISDVVVENMQMQMEDIIGTSAQPAAIAAPPAATIMAAPAQPEVTVMPGTVAVVVVAAGPGLADIFRSLGAAAIVSGGQSNNPSTEEIFQAIESVPTDKIVVLPNNKNIILAAEAACALSSKEVVIVRTLTTPQGIGALLSFNPTAVDLETARVEMEMASQEIASGEITIATRSVTLDGVEVEEGALIGLVDGRLCTSGKLMEQVLVDTLRVMNVAKRELLSVYYGEGVSEEEAQEIVDQIEELYPDLEIEIFQGGQPHYLYILGAE